MKGEFLMFSRRIAAFVITVSLLSPVLASNNQTDTLSPILPGSSLPFQIVIEKVPFELPVGLHSGAVGVSKGLWIFIAGRMNGLHGFGGDPFPADEQNTRIYVVDPSAHQVYSRALNDASSGLSQAQIDTLSVTSPESYQDADTLYLVGGYGVDTASGTFGTKPMLTAIYLPGIVQWVMHPEDVKQSVVKNIQQVSNPILQVTGGQMFKSGNVTLLIFGQNFTGQYTNGSNGEYTQQVRIFKIKSSSGKLAVDVLNSNPQIPNPNYRRRDLNIVPVLLNKNNLLKYGFVAYGGVFTLASGVWTVPVVIDDEGNSTMADPNLPSTFKQGMNQYVSASVGLYSRKIMSNYNLFFGGISYGFYSNGTFETDAEIPFINQVTTIQMDKNGNMTQYLMSGEYPVILSTQANPGNQLLFGAGAYFLANPISKFANSMINLDSIRQPTVIGYIVGGIQSTLPNTNQDSDSAASPYIFKVTLIPIS